MGISGTFVRNLGFTAQVAPIIKRATGQMSDGSAVLIIPDTNIAGLAGDDVTGVAKLHIYKSDTTRATWNLNATFTLSPASSSSTIAAVMSMVLDSSNNIHLVYQGTDWSLNYRFFTFGSGTWTLTTSQTIVAASGSVTSRYRALDIDITGSGSTANPAVIVYEAKTSAGLSNWTRVYIRNSDGTTWRKAYEEDADTLAGGGPRTIFPQSEDVSISWNQAGLSSNVGQLLYYGTRTASDWDRGDVTRELQYNVSTGTDGSATVLGTWPVLNQDVAAGARRGWVFKTSSNLWQVALVAGLGVPQFQVMRLQHNQFGAPVINTLNQLPHPTWTPVILNSSTFINVDRSANPYNYIACVYNDNRVMFGFVTKTVPSHINSFGFALGCIVFRYNDVSSFSTSYNDISIRPLDNYTVFGQQPIGIYGSGNNRNQVNDFKFNFLALYGYPGNDTTGTYKNDARFVVDTFYDAPTVVGPTATVATDSPILQVRVENSALYPNIKGKIEFNLARDGVFTTDNRVIDQPDSAYQYFGSTSASPPSPISVSYQLSGIGTEKLYSGTWYLRARVLSDLGTPSPWSNVQQFSVSHPPTALPRQPLSGSPTPYGVGNIVFAWGMSDTESTDVQTAYRLKVNRVDTGASVIDTGKVTSSIQSVIQTISSTYKNVTLQWTVQLWDTDDVQGPPSNPVLFTLGDAPSVAITSPTTGGTVTSAAPTVSWNFAGTNGRTQYAFRVSAFLAELLDTFTRTVSNGWGTSDTTDVWTISTGAAAQFSVGSGSAKCLVNAVNSDFSIINSELQLNGDFLTEIVLPVAPTGNPAVVKVIARQVDPNNSYQVIYQFNTDLSCSIGLDKTVGGVSSTVVSVAAMPSFTYAAATSYMLRISMLGNAIKAKIWLKSAGEPAIWGLDTTDSSITSIGKWGFLFRLSTGNTNTLPFTFQVDNVAITDLSIGVVADSNWITGTQASYTFVNNVLETGKFYGIQVQVQDSDAMLGGSYVGVLTTWTHPALGDITVTTDDFGATVQWTNANIDLSFNRWRVYRKYMVPAIPELDDNDTDNTWVLLYETTDNVGPYSFKDYLCPNQKDVSYVVVQLADRFGSLIESDITSFVTIVLPSDRYFFVPSVPIGSIASYEAANVTDDSFTDEIEQATLHIIGRGRQVQVGDDLGLSGTLTIQLRNPVSARADREFLQRLASSKTINVYMKTPFGDVTLIKFQSVQVKRIGGFGPNDMVDLQIPYTEVFDVVPVTRTA